MSSSSVQTFTDLLEMPEFIQWRSGEKPEYGVFWENWLIRNPDKAELFEQAKVAYLLFRDKPLELTPEHVLLKIQESLEIAKQKEKEQHKRFVFTPNLIRKIAASVIFLLVANFFIFWQGKNDSRKEATAATLIEKPLNAPIQISNHNDKQKYIHLPDGSSVILQKDSELSYADPFDKLKREVYLKGEAFFEISKNNEVPFYVYSNELVTQVEGTSFRITSNAYADHEIVSVKSGNVLVYPKNIQKSSQSVSLKSSQQVKYNKLQSEFEVSTKFKKSLAQLPIEAQVFSFVHTPVKEVFKTLENAYGVQIEYDQEKLSKCSVTATMGDEPLDNKLKWLCTILEGEYVITDDKISIIAQACQ